MSAISISFDPSSKVIEEIALDALALVWTLGLSLDETIIHEIEGYQKQHALVSHYQLSGGGNGIDGPVLW